MASNTLLRSLHDLGLAGWFGGSLMGITGLRAGANSGTDSPSTRTDRETAGWNAWSPVAAVSIGAHLVGGAGLIVVNRRRHRHQDSVKTLTLVKAGLTGAAMATTALQSVIGRRLRDAEQRAHAGETGAQQAAARLRTQVRALGVATPVLTGTLVVLGAREGELQRPSEVVSGTLKHLTDSVPSSVSDKIGDVASTARSAVADSFANGSESIAEKFADLRDRFDGDVVSDVVDDLKELKNTVLDKVHLTS